MPRSLPILDRAALEAMPTGSLLSRLRRLLACEESREASDRPDETTDRAPGRVIEFKQSAEWTAAHREFKEILAGREHLPTSQERHAKRMARAASKPNGQKRK